MLVFIDETGDAGFKLSKGSTPLFAAAMVIFETADAAAATGDVIRGAQQALGVKPEFKFSSCRDGARDGFFDSIRDCDFIVRAIVVEKEKIYSPRLRTDKEQFYRFFIKNMVRFDNGTLQDAKVIIDGSGDRSFRRDLKKQLRRHTAPGVIKDVRFGKSHNDPLVQLADMCAGAIARSYRTDRKNADRWRQMLQPKIDDVWEFQ